MVLFCVLPFQGKFLIGYFFMSCRRKQMSLDKLMNLLQPSVLPHSLPIRNGVKSLWVRFLYFPDFWMVFVSYFPNFLWSPFLIFFIYFFEKHKFIFITKNLDIFTHYSIAIVWFECIFFLIISLLASFWIF